MWWTEIRGVLVVILVAAGIAVAWTRIEAWQSSAAEPLAVTTTSTTTSTVAPTTTLSSEEINLVICERSRSFADAAALVDPDTGPGPVARLALDFWSDIDRLTEGDVRAEVSAVVSYYEDYLEQAEPFDFDPDRIIVEGDKEKIQQLLTRPAPGLEGSRGLIGFACGVTVPEQPSMPARDFDELEDRLLDTSNGE